MFNDSLSSYQKMINITEYGFGLMKAQLMYKLHPKSKKHS